MISISISLYQALTLHNNSNSPTNKEINEEEIVSLLYSYFAGQLVFKVQLGHFHHSGQHEGNFLNRMCVYDGANFAKVDFDESSSLDNQFRESLVIIHKMFMGTAKMLNFSRVIELLNAIASFSDSYHPDFINNESNIQSVLTTMSNYISTTFSAKEVAVIAKAVEPFSLTNTLHYLLKHEHSLTVERVVQLEKKMEMVITMESERAAITAELVIRNNENIQWNAELQNDVEVIEKKITVMEIGILWLVQKVLELEHAVSALVWKNAELEKKNAELQVIVDKVRSDIGKNNAHYEKQQKQQQQTVHGAKSF